jgi:hypothetical protein
MLVIRHYSTDGIEFVLEAASLRYTPGCPPDGTPRTLELLDIKNQPILVLSSGDVYAMNDRGTTVAAYHLSRY